MPIPSAGTEDPTPTAVPGHPQLLAMGAPVRVRIGGVDAVVTALGPEQLPDRPSGAATPAPTVGPGARAVGVFTLQVQVRSGTLAVAAGELSARDELGTAVRLTPRGPARVSAGPGGTARLAVQGEFDSGSAALTWRHGRRVLAIWDFTIELD
ncbi:hypothetical protein [Nakamurella endophytica]|uniref:hypothetical protein n=1 Tax=Nakamurella endophytica TaxID=1748367 RepID=UPI00166873DD|nr:hypothetical protein [Nakamurella endophytica]